MKKNFWILLIVILVSGCAYNSPENEESSTQSESMSNTEQKTGDFDFPEKLECEEGNVKFNCEVEIDANLKTEKIYTATASQCEINVENAFDELYSEITDYDTYEYEEKNEYGNTVQTATYVDKNETSFSFGPMSSKLSFMKMDKMPYILSAFRLDESYDDYNANLFSIENQLSFATREETYSDLITLFEKIGAPTEYKYKAYALDYNTLKTEEKHEDMDGNDDQSSYKKEWSSDDDAYYFVMRQCFEKLPVYHVYAEIFSTEADMNTPVQAVISSEGLESLDIEKIFTFTDKKEVINMVSLDDVVTTVSNKYNQILGDGTYEITYVELYYYVDLSGETGTYEVYPCWILKGVEMKNDGESNIQIIIDAQTGEELIP